MSRGVRVLSRLQLPPALLERLSPASHPERGAPPDLVFYTGCNLLKTPHIGLLCLDVLDRLGLSYEVHGGPSACCGILPLRSGDDENALRQSGRTRERLAAAGAGAVLSWCPTCQMQFAETTLPVQAGAPGAAIDMTMFPVFLARRLEALRPYLERPVPKRVALHEHPGTPGVLEAVHALLGAVPGLEVVSLELPRIGYSLNSLAAVPGLAPRVVARELAAAERAGVDCLVSIYHTEHRELAGHEGQWRFEVRNYMELLGESMGIARDDVFKRLKAMRDVDEVLHACAPVLEANGVPVEEAREVVAAEILGGQVLPVERAEHARYLAE
jgi:heterodisulfide reductase subunit B